MWGRSRTPAASGSSATPNAAIHAVLWDYAEKQGITIDRLKKPKSNISEGEEEEDYGAL